MTLCRAWIGRPSAPLSRLQVGKNKSSDSEGGSNASLMSQAFQFRNPRCQRLRVGRRPGAQRASRRRTPHERGKPQPLFSQVTRPHSRQQELSLRLDVTRRRSAFEFSLSLV